MNFRKTAVVVAVLSAITAQASGRVGNGIMPSLEYRCIPEEPIYSWCESFGNGRPIVPGDFNEGLTLFVDLAGDSIPGAPTAGIAVIRHADQLSYLLYEGKGSEEEARDYLLSHAKDARALRLNDWSADYLDHVNVSETEQWRIVLRVSPKGELVARWESKAVGSAFYSERSYLRVRMDTR